jgi:hypothetical protein
MPVAVKDYDGLEAALYTLTSLAEYWMTEWAELLNQVLTNVLPVISESRHSRLVRTTLCLLEAFAGPIIAMGQMPMEISLKFTLSIISNDLYVVNIPVGLRSLNELLQGKLQPDFAYHMSAAILKLSHHIPVSIF